MWLLALLIGIAQAAPRLVPQIAHSAKVDAVAISPDGQLLATGAGDRSVRLWHVPSHRLLHAWLDLPGDPDELRFDDTSRRLAFTLDRDRDLPLAEGMVQWVDLLTMERRALAVPKIGASGVQFESSGVLVVNIDEPDVWFSEDGWNRWDTADPNAMVPQPRPDDTAPVQMASLHAEPVSVTNDKGIVIVHRPHSPPTPLVQVAASRSADVNFSPDGAYLGVLTPKTADLWDVQTLQWVNSSGDIGDRYGNTVDVSGGSAQVLEGPREARFKGGRLHYPVWGPCARVTAGMVCGDISFDERLHHFPDGEDWDRRKSYGKAYLTRMEGSPAGDAVLASLEPLPGGEGGKEAAMLWRMDGGSKRFKGVASGAVQWGAGGDRFVVGYPDGQVAIHSSGGARKKTWQAHRQRVTGVAMDVTGAHVVTSALDGTVVLWNAEGERIRELESGIPTVRELVFHPSLPLVAGSVADGRTGLWRVDEPAHAYLIQGIDDWIVFRSDGMFDASRRGVELVAVVDGLTPQGLEANAVHTNRPDLILSDLGLGDPTLHAEFQALHQRRVRKAGDNGDGPAPTASIIQVTDGREATISWSAADANGALNEIRIAVNGVPLITESASGSEARGDTTLVLPEGRHHLEVSAVDAQGREGPRAYGTVAGGEGEAPQLWYVGFGVSDYARDDLDLKWAHQDALDLAAHFEGWDGADAQAQTWIDAEVDLAAVDEARAFLAQARPEDTVVLFIAGHGLYGDDGVWYYLPHAVDPTDLPGTAIPYGRVESVLDGLPALRKLVLLDTCESGERDDSNAVAMAEAGRFRPRSLRGLSVQRKAGHVVPISVAADTERFIYNDLSRRSGAIVLSSSRGTEDSLELDALEQGLFTHAVLAALSGAGDVDLDGMVSEDELRAYVEAQVTELSEDRQHPTVDRDNLWVDILFRVRE